MRIQLDYYERNEQPSSSRGRGAGRSNNNNSPNSISNPRPLSTLNPNFGMGPSFVELENLKRANSKLQEELKESHQTVEELVKELSDSGEILRELRINPIEETDLPFVSSSQVSTSLLLVPRVVGNPQSMSSMRKRRKKNCRIELLACEGEKRIIDWVLQL